MRTVTQNFIDQKNAEANKPVRLYIVEEGPISPAVLYYAEYSQNITFQGNVYVSIPIKSEDLTENMANEIDQTTVTFGPVDGSLIALLEDYDGLRGCKVTRRTVFMDSLNSPDYTDDILWVASVVLTSNAAAFTLKSKMDLFNLELPLRRFYRLTCQWSFKGAECKYVGATATCNHTLAACKALNNIRRFGGFPGTGTAIRRIYV